jgi:hypothetical protein
LRTIDMRLAQYGAAHDHAGCVPLLLIHDGSPVALVGVNFSR